MVGSTGRQALGVRRLWNFSFAFVAFLMVLAGSVTAGFAVASLQASRSDVSAEAIWVGPDLATPALRLAPRPPDGDQTATVLVVHGFAGSKEMMRPLGYTLARAGFTVYLVDLPGHGLSRLRLDRGTPTALDEWLVGVVTDLVTRGLASPGRLYLVGHSLGTLVVTRTAVEHPDLGVAGVVALSPIYSGITPTQPPNYLALTGEGELPGVKEAAVAALRAGTGLEDPTLETLYGDFGAGTARSAGPVRGATHITIVDAPQTLTQTVVWLRSSLAGAPSTAQVPRLERGRSERGFGLLGAVVVALGVFYLVAGGLGLLGHAPRTPDARAVIEEARVAAGLPRQPEPPRPGAAPAPLPDAVKAAHERATQLLAGTRVIPLLYAFAAVVATAVAGLVRVGPLVRQAGSDYLSLYLLVFTAVTAPGLAFIGQAIRTGPLVTTGTRLGWWRSVLLGLFFFAVFSAALGWVGTFTWTRLIPPTWRWAHIAGLALLFLPFAVTDELARSTVHDRAGLVWGLVVGAVGKLIIVLTWYAGMVLPNPPQSLVVVAPVFGWVLVGLDGVVSLFYNEHGSWLAGAVFKALALAWMVGTIFPLLV